MVLQTHTVLSGLWCSVSSRSVRELNTAGVNAVHVNVSYTDTCLLSEDNTVCMAFIYKHKYNCIT